MSTYINGNNIINYIYFLVFNRNEIWAINKLFSPQEWCTDRYKDSNGMLYNVKYLPDMKLFLILQFIINTELYDIKINIIKYCIHIFEKKNGKQIIYLN